MKKFKFDENEFKKDFEKYLEDEHLCKAEDWCEIIDASLKKDGIKSKYLDINLNPKFLSECFIEQGTQIKRYSGINWINHVYENFIKENCLRELSDKDYAEGLHKYLSKTLSQSDYLVFVDGREYDDLFLSNERYEKIIKLAREKCIAAKSYSDEAEKELIIEMIFNKDEGEEND